MVRGPLARDTLHLDAIPLRDQAERLAWLAEHLPSMPGAGIVYCLTVADTQRVAGWLRGRGIDARPYNADIDPAEREALEQDLLANRLKALVATVALGMGFDKPDLGFVIHYQRPGSPIAYYQQVGRAGRAVENAYGILLSGREDDAIAEYFMATAFPPAARMKDILAALEAVDSATIKGLQAQVNLPYGQIEKALKLLEVDGAVARERGRFVRTGEPWEQDEAWVAAVLEARRRELASMREYVDTDSCRMAFLGRLLNDPAAGECGHCANDGGVRWPRSVSPALVQDAVAYLRRDVRAIDPRRQWPEGARIAKPNEIGRALCILGDPGWGRDVARVVSSAAGPGTGPAVRGPSRRRRDGGHPWPLAPEPDAGVGDLRAVAGAAGFRRGVRGAAGVGAGAAVRRVPDVRRRPAAGPDAEQRPAGRERADAAGRRRAGRAVRTRAAGGRPGGLALDAHRGRVPAAGGGCGPGAPVRACRGDAARGVASATAVALLRHARGGERGLATIVNRRYARDLGPLPRAVRVPAWMR